MSDLAVLLNDACTVGKLTPEKIAAELNVSSTSVARWMAGKGLPRPKVEGELRRLCSGAIQTTLLFEPLPTLAAAGSAEQKLRDALGNTLQQIREILHRRSRFSSRNEAVDEICKMLFAHLMAFLHGGEGISRGLRDTPTGTTATKLKEFVDRIYKQYIPAAMAKELSAEDYGLRIKEQEVALADELVDAFHSLGEELREDRALLLHRMDLFNEVFGSFLAGSFQDEKQLGQYLTPSEVVRFMVRLAVEKLTASELEALCQLDGNDFGYILDPSCGVASFLAETLHAATPLVVSRHGEEGVQPWLRHMLSSVLVGIDKSERMGRLALTQLASFGIEPKQLHVASSLATSGPEAEVTSALEGKVGLILTNPPFGAEFTGEDLEGMGNESTGKTIPSEVLFLERYIRWLRPGGHCFAIVPDSILTNRGSYEVLRSKLRETAVLQDVVSLPPETFSAAGTTTKTSVLHFVKRGGSSLPAQRAFFAICTDVGFTVQSKATRKHKRANETGELPRILDESVGRGVPKLGRWVDNPQQFSRWDATYHASLPSELARRLRTRKLTDVAVSDVADLAADRADPRRSSSPTFRYIEISDVDPVTCSVTAKTIPCSDAPSRARRVVKAGDVLVSTVRPERGVVGVVDEDLDGSICSTGFAVLRPKAIGSFTLARLLQSRSAIQQIMRHNMGVAYPAVEESCLPSIVLPTSTDELARLDKLEGKLREARAAMRNLDREFTRVAEESERGWSVSG